MNYNDKIPMSYIMFNILSVGLAPDKETLEIIVNYIS